MAEKTAHGYLLGSGTYAAARQVYLMLPCQAIVHMDKLFTCVRPFAEASVEAVSRMPQEELERV